MGNNKSRPRNANTRAATTAARVAATNATAANVATLQQRIVASTTPISTSDIVQHDERIQQVLAATVVAQKQIVRGGDALTKDDMIAIVLVLKTIVKRESWFDRADVVGSLTREDLVASIRTIVFDPSTIQSILELITEPGPAPAPAPHAPGIHEAHDEIFIPEHAIPVSPPRQTAIVPMSAPARPPMAIVPMSGAARSMQTAIVPLGAARQLQTAIVPMSRTARPTDAFLTVFG